MQIAKVDYTINNSLVSALFILRAQFGTPVHEIGHALGLFHEQSRWDRDQSIQVLWDNINPSWDDQYYIAYETDPLGVPYDHGSVMHYPSLVRP